MNKIFTTLTKCALLYALLFTSAFKANATDTTGVFSVSFNAAPTLISGSLNQVGSQYRFANVAPGRSALVTIVSATGGAKVDMLDDNNLTKPEAFSPRITIPGNSTGMVEFQVTFLAGNSNNPKKVDTLYATAMDIDGNSSLHEMDALNLGGGTLSYQASTIEIMVTQTGTQFLGQNVGGVEYPSVDTSAKAVMFTVTNKDVETFIYKAGAQNLSADAVTRQKGVYFSGFVYPSFSTLPVTITNLSATSRNEGNLVQWQTSSEINTKAFFIEKSIDGRNYTTIGEVAAAGQSSTTRSYRFTDALVKPGTNYYRLRAVDRDGQFTYSAAVLVKTEGQAHQVSLFPCPVKDFTVVSISANASETITLRMLDANGKALYSRTENISKGTTNIRLGQMDRYSPGTYYIQVVQRDKTTTKPFMIL
jgi:hypothetical protein